MLIKYDDKQSVATVKGVDEQYINITSIDKMITDGKYILKQNDINYAIIGRSLSYFLGINIRFLNQCKLLVPRRLKKISFNPNEALNSAYIAPAGIFTIEPEIDQKYIIIPISLARKLFEYPNQLSSLEIKTDSKYNAPTIQKQIQNLLGENFNVKNRYQQNELIFKTMKSEKWAIFFILAFILIIASFNIIGSLTMLIIEKKDDISTLQSLGTNISTLKKVFVTEGFMITGFGGISGLIIGLIICFLQIKYGFVKLPGSGTFIINTYPVAVQLKDIILVLITVVSVGFFVAWYPVRYVMKKFVNQNN